MQPTLERLAERGEAAEVTVVHEPDVTQDRRIVRSKRALKTALIELMEERGFESFTVNDLCVRADLNRGTFYNHFSDKYDLLLSLEEDIIRNLDRFRYEIQKISLFDLMRIRITKKPFPFLIDLFDYLREEGDFLHAVLGPGGDVRFAPRMREAICNDLIKSILHERYRNDPSPFVGYYIAFYASAYFGIISRWINTGMKESSEEMSKIAVRLLFIQAGEAIEL